MKTLFVILMFPLALLGVDFSTVPNYVASVTTNVGVITNISSGSGLTVTIQTNGSDNSKSAIISVNQSSSTNVSNPLVSGGYWTNKTGVYGTLYINGTLTGSAITGFPGMCITNIVTGQVLNPTNSIVLGVLNPFNLSMKVFPNDYVICTNKSSGSASALITGSLFIGP